MEQQRIFKRKIYDALLEWKNAPIHNSALLIEGARRIGKSTIVREFAKNEYPDFIMVDFRTESEDVKALFNNTKDLDAFYRNFFLLQNHVLKPGGLIIFDEIQFCPKAREAIKDFVADGRYAFIETGSLISIKENTQGIMIPSEERRIEMHPMDFEEFLWASEKNDSYPLLSEFLKRHEEVPQQIHREYMEKFRTYMLVGGMPKVLSIFLETNSFKLAEQEKEDILKLYRDDLRKHDDKHGTICGQLFDAIPAQLAKENRRFLLRSGADAGRYSKIEKSLHDLADFKIVTRIPYVVDMQPPLSLAQEEGRFKLYFCDTGLLLTKLAALSKQNDGEAFFAFIKGRRSLNLGALYESIVAQQLTAMGFALYYHKYQLADSEHGKSTIYELDLVAEEAFKPIAFEVKSAKTYTTASLDHLKDKYPQLKIRRIVTGIKNLKYEGDKVTLPAYMIPLFF